MVSDRCLVDTNVLVYASFTTSPQHGACRALLERARDADAGLCLFPQILAEFFAVVTNPRRVSPPKSPEEALQAIEQFLSLPGLALLPLPADVVARWLPLVRTRPVTGGDVFDLQAAAAMLGHGIGTIYTYNLTDFRDIPGVVAKEPLPPPSP